MSNDYNSTSTAVTNTTCPVCGGTLVMSKNGTIRSCDKCNYIEVTTIGDIDTSNLSDSTTNPLVNEPDNKPKGLYGWICPRCGAVMSPFTSFCPNCTKNNWEITYATSGTSTLQSQLKKSNFNVNDFIGGRKDKLGYE